jgi:hypothetical protein
MPCRWLRLRPLTRARSGRRSRLARPALARLGRRGGRRRPGARSGLTLRLLSQTTGQGLAPGALWPGRTVVRTRWRRCGSGWSAWRRAVGRRGPFAWDLLDGLRRLSAPDATTADVDVEVPGAGTRSAPWRTSLGPRGIPVAPVAPRTRGPPEAGDRRGLPGHSRPMCPTCSPSWPLRRSSASAGRRSGGPDGLTPDRLAAYCGHGQGPVGRRRRRPRSSPASGDADWRSPGTSSTPPTTGCLHPDAVAQVLAQVDLGPGTRPRHGADRASVHRPELMAAAAGRGGRLRGRR